MTDFELTKNLLVSIPHAGLQCPPEISMNQLSEFTGDLTLENVDWHTHLIYDFRDILHNKQLVFNYNQIFINVNRHPKYIDEAVPNTIGNIPIYKNELELELRWLLIKRYHVLYHTKIINTKKNFILDGHSTNSTCVDDAGNPLTADIYLSDSQKSALDPPEGIKTAPDGYLACYANELQKRLPSLKIQLNSAYSATYGHIMSLHGANRRNGTPLILQETNEDLYMKNNIADYKAIEELRRVFAEALKMLLLRFVSP